MFIDETTPRADLEAAALEAGIEASGLSDAALLEAVSDWIAEGDECGACT